MTNKSVSQKWTEEYCAPVVLTFATAAVENICLKNGLLFHELLSSFGHLDGVSGTIRSNNQQFMINSNLIRFERSTEAVEKPSDLVEKRLSECFAPFDVNLMPGAASSLKATPPSAWSDLVEKTLLYSMSFSEFDMLSNPVVLLYAVSASDSDPLACLTELMSKHHNPDCLSAGLYDADIQRVCVLVHDSGAETACHVPTLFKQMQAAYSARHTKMLTLNYFKPENANVQQPDMWTRWMIPAYFDHLTPKASSPALQDSRLVDPVTGKVRYGTLLSMDDLLALRNFCVSLWQEELIPAIERRVSVLTRIVGESRKGVKNVFKSFWRKPREDTGSEGGQVRYRHDRIEAQTLLLGDLSFVIQDYENALQMYKLVKDDFKSDKSSVHLAHTCVMMALSLLKMDGPQTTSSRRKEIFACLDSLKEAIGTFTFNSGPLHSIAYYCLLGAEVYSQLSSQVSHGSSRCLYEAAHFMLVAAPAVLRHPLLNALVVERASLYFLQARHTRKFALYEIIAANKFRKCGEKPRLHATACYASIMLLLEGCHWGDMLVVLAKKLSDQLPYHVDAAAPVVVDAAELPPLSAQRALLLMLQVVECAVDDAQINGMRVNEDAITVLSELLEAKSDGASGAGTTDICVREEWSREVTSVRRLLLEDVPIRRLHREGGVDGGADVTQVVGLHVPQLRENHISLLYPLNGSLAALEHGTISPLRSAAVYAEALLAVESSWCGQNPRATPATVSLLVDAWLSAEEAVLHDIQNEVKSRGTLTPWSKAGSGPALLQVPIYEPLQVAVMAYNPLPISLLLSQVKLELHPLALPPGSGPTSPMASRKGDPGPFVVDAEVTTCADSCFDIAPAECMVHPEESKNIVLTALPKVAGRFQVTAITYQLSKNLVVRQPICKEGYLLQKTMQQRMNRQRGTDDSLSFEVVDRCALLNVTFHSTVGGADVDGSAGFPQEVLYGELVQTTLHVENIGTAAAGNVSFKFSIPTAVVSVMTQVGDSWELQAGTDAPLKQSGPSSSIIELPSTHAALAPGGSVRLVVWLYMAISPSAAPDNDSGQGGASMAAAGGKGKLTVLARYASGDVQGSGVENDTRRMQSNWRTSFATTEYYVSPSVASCARVVARSTSTHKRTLVYSMTNCLNSSSIDAASVDAGDGTNEEDVPLREGECVACGLWCLGRVHVDSAKSTTNSPAIAQRCSPQERVTACFPVTSLHGSPRAADAGAETSWIYRGSIDGAAELMLDSAGRFEAVLEQLLCKSAQCASFYSVLRQRRFEKLIEEQETAEKGPRTISQVRKENVRNRADGSDDVAGAEADAERCARYPTSMCDLAHAHVQEGTLGLLALWKCCWKGRVRYGFQRLPPMVVTQTSAGPGRMLINTTLGLSSCTHWMELLECNPALRSTPAYVSTLRQVLADYVSVSIRHPARVSLNSAGSSVQVYLDLFCVAQNLDIFVSVECLDKRVIVLPSVAGGVAFPSAGGITGSKRGSGQVHRMSVSAEAATGAYQSSAAAASATSNMAALPVGKGGGQRWEGQTKQIGVKLIPNSTTTLTFACSFSKTGIYDLNRFKIMVSNLNPVHTATNPPSGLSGKGTNISTEKIFAVQSLIEIV